MNLGFIKLDRAILNWEWYEDPNVFKVLIHCLLKANFTTKKWKGYTIKKGQFVTSNDKLSIQTGLTVSQTRTALGKLKDSGYIKINANSKFTVITVSPEFNDYLNIESESQTDNTKKTNNGGDSGREKPKYSQANSKPLASKAPANSIPVTTTKNAKELKNVKKENKERIKREIFQLSQYPENNLNRFYEYYTEENIAGTMRFESYEFWNTEARVKKWMANERHSKTNFKAESELQTNR